MLETIDPNAPIRLRPRGPMRFLVAAFLFVWLCGWAAGETFALTTLVRGGLGMLSGTPPQSSHPPMTWGPALAMGAFLVLWLTFWTIGGFLAIQEFLRQIWAEDRITVTPDGLDLRQQLGPFVSHRHVPRSELRGFALRFKMPAVVVQTATGSFELTRLGTAQERDQLVTRLRDVLHVGEAQSDAPPTLPAGWEEIVTPEGFPVLVRGVKARAILSKVIVVVAVGMTAVAVTLAHDAAMTPSLVPLAAFFTGMALLFGWIAMWLARSRDEWRIGNGRITLQRRFGSSLTDQFEAQSLELVNSNDSDGDAWFSLNAVAAPGSDGGPAKRRRILQSMRDATTPRMLGRWLAARAAVTFDDRASRPETLDLQTLASMLEQSGPLGRFVARNLVSRLGKLPRSGA